MRKKIIFLCSLALISTSAVARAETPKPGSTPQECSVPVAHSVDKRLKVSAKPDPQFAKRDRERYQGQIITLRATFCGSGMVTDISVTKGLTSDMNAAAIDAAKLIQFTPAEKDGQKVSQILTIRYLVK